MKRPILRAGLIVGALGMGLTGCQQAGHTSAVSQGKPGDPTAWTDKDVSGGDAESGTTKSGLPKSSRLSGSWSSEARDIENSLGVGK